jgi:hypothetical protein
MPSLVAKKKTRQRELGSPRTEYEVRLLYLPFFLASNQTLIQHLDRRLRERFQGQTVFEGDPKVEQEMTQVVIDAVLEKHPIQGLREVLEAIAAMVPGQRIPADEIPNLDVEVVQEEPPKLEMVSLNEALSPSDEVVVTSPPSSAERGL